MNNRYADLKLNDIVDCDSGICASFWTQGCPFRCKDCHNPQTWDYSGGKLLPPDIIDQIINGISANEINRNFSVLGGEPLCDINVSLVDFIVQKVRDTYPSIVIYVWTGYTVDELNIRRQSIPELNNILTNIDTLIDGRYDNSKRDITLQLRGSSNQRILHKGKDF